MNVKILGFGLLMVFACKTDDSFLQDPNNPNTNQLDVNFYFNYVQTTLPAVLKDLYLSSGELVRMQAMTESSYDQHRRSGSLNGVWEDAYSGVLFNLKKGSELALAGKYYTHYAIMQTLKAYLLMSLVDVWGNVPYSEALNADSLNPRLDSGAVVYAAALAALNEALLYFDKTAYQEPTSDLYYKNDKLKWKKCINSLKLKYFLQTRYVNSASKDSINVLITKSLISSSDDDLQFQYGKNNSSPDTRHPFYRSNYTGDGVAYYLGNYGMRLLYENDSDPRWRFLLYRQSQVSTIANSSNLPCLDGIRPSHYSSSDIFCTDNIFWGRDHGDASGGNPDGKYITTFGLYPVGGLFDDGSKKSIEASDGAGGAGVMPMLTSSFVKLYRLEAALTLTTNDAGTELTLYKNAISDFSNKLLNFKTQIGYSANIDTSNNLYSNGYAVTFNSYLTNKANAFTAANAAQQLELAMKEFYKCSWGNGLEVYNNYRRTGYPSDFQPARTSNPGTFPRSYFYCQNSILYNTHIQQKSDLGVKVFWNTNTVTLK